MGEVIVSMKNIVKNFPGVKALDNVSFELRSGEVMALLGENGAGKSTLMKILSGVYTKDGGTMEIFGKSYEALTPKQAQAAGVAIIHQELNMCRHLSVTENMFLGREKVNGVLLKNSEMEAEASDILGQLKIDIDPRQTVGDLPVSKQQMVEIAKALSIHARILIMDEPTSSLTDNETEVLFRVIRRLKASGVGIIYISHRMSELDEISDRITIMRDGEYIDTVVTKDTGHDQLVALMAGRSLGDLYDKHSHASGEVLLKVEHLSCGREVKDVSFELHKGEVLGFSGLVGSGRSETMTCLFGLRKKSGGKVLLEGREVEARSVKEAMKLGIGLVPEDRKKEGIFGIQGIRFNATIEVLEQFMGGGRYDKDKEAELARQYVDHVMNTRYAGLEQPIERLSGGNQQKVIISRWLLATKSILILDEPTRGIDVKAKSDIYHLIDRLTAEGLSIIFISSEMPELINMCDRIVVMNQGRTTGVLSREEFAQERIMALATKEI